MLLNCYAGALVCLVLIGSSAWGQNQIDTSSYQAPKWNDSFVSFHLGGGLAELNRDQPTKSDRFGDPFLWSYRAGFSVEAINTRYYGLRVELAYVRRGGVEEFAGLNGLLIQSKTALHYGQISFLPAIAKIGSSRFRGFVGAGGYAAYLIASDLRYTFKGNTVVDINELFSAAVKKIDYGAIVSTGFYWKKTIVELRYEAGIAPVYQYPDGRTIYNRGASFIIHL